MVALIVRRSARTEPATYRQLTFRRGTILTARFARDGESIVYGAAWDGEPFRVFSLSAGRRESAAIALPPADVLSVSTSGELALALDRHYSRRFTFEGTLARAPFAGGAPRQLLERVEEADWGPDGNLAVVRMLRGEIRLEWPEGRVGVDPSQPDTIYGANTSGVEKSLDGGCDWQWAGDGLPGRSELVVIDPSNPSTLYVGTVLFGAYKSSYSGTSWSPVNNGMPYEEVPSIAVDPNDSSRLWATNNHKTFTPIGNVPSFDTGYGMVLRSNDAGASWQPAAGGLPTGQGIEYFSLVVDPASSNSLWVWGSQVGVFRSDDGGDTWTASASGPDDLTALGTIALAPGSSTHLLLGLSFAALSRSDDGGATWTQSREGLVLDQWRRLSTAKSAPDVLYAAGSGGAAGIVRSTDGGQTWQNTSPPFGNLVGWTVAVDPTNASVVYAAGLDGSSAGRHQSIRSVDGGTNWIQVLPEGYRINDFAVDPSNPSHVFACGNQVGDSNGVNRSTDGGATWVASSTQFGDLPDRILVRGGGLPHFLVVDGNLYRSTDDGDTWTPAQGGPMQIQALAAAPSNPSTLYAATGVGLYGSTDGGVTWSQAGNVNLWISVVVVDPNDSNDLFIRPSWGQSGVLRSTDGGVTWQDFNRDLRGISKDSVTDLAFSADGTTLHAATREGVLEYRFSSDAGPSLSSAAPASGPAAGGTVVTMSGLGFQSGASVFVGGAQAASVNVIGGGTLSMTTPAGPPGAVDVMEINSDTQFATLTRGFVYDFEDVPAGSEFHDAVVSLTRVGVAVGCGNGLFCPTDAVTRGQMAVFIEKAVRGAGFPYLVRTLQFADVSKCLPQAPFIVQLSIDEITVGCGSDLFCPDAPTTRAQAAVFILKAEHGSSYVPPPATGTVFLDVPADAFAAAFIEELALEGIAAGCGGGNYCPDASLTRGQAAAFVSASILPQP